MSDEVPRPGPKPTRGASSPIVWAIGGGKGGVGKSVVSANLGVILASRGHRVTLVDCDLGGANLETILGCETPAHTLADFFSRKVASLGDLAVPTTVPGLRLIAGDSETLGAANPAFAQKGKLLRHLTHLEADFVVCDLGAGTSFNTLDLYLAADLGIVVTTPEPTALQNCFAFIKAATLRDLEQQTGIQRRDKVQESVRHVIVQESEKGQTSLSRSTRLIVNRAQGADGRRVSNVLNDLAGRFLGGRVQLAGVIRDDALVMRSIQKMTPLCLEDRSAPAAIDLESVADLLLRREEDRASPNFGVNEHVDLRGVTVHVQTEDLGNDQAAIRTQVFLGDGSVAYSRRTPYADNFFRQLQATGAQRVRFHHAAIKRALQEGRIEVVLRGTG